jgi:NitT/TauT family transport system substrate-binding protein
VKPWEVYQNFMAESWLTTGAWADKNERALVDLNKAMITSFRRANSDYDYFAKGYRKYATVSDAAKISDEKLRPEWETLSKTIAAWPNDGGFEQSNFAALEPVYREAKVIGGKFDFSKVVDTRYVKQALHELA